MNHIDGLVYGFMVFNATFNNISFISGRSDLLVEDTGEYHRTAASHWQTLSHNVEHLALIKVKLCGRDCCDES